MSYGVTAAGFVIKPLSQIKTDIVSELATVSDPVSGESLTVNLDNENDPLVNIVDCLSSALATCWEELALCYDQFNPLLASGAGLSGTVLLNGIQRRAGSPTLVTVQLTGTPNLSIAAGYQITTVDGSLNFTLPAFTFNSSGQAEAVATCTVIGVNAVAANTLTRFAQYIAGVDTVTNAAAGTTGTDEETDAALAARQQGSAAAPSRASVDAIFANLMNITGVTFCRVFQNIYLSTDSRGIPPKCVAVVIVGGNDNDIATCIFNTTGGVGTYGTTSINLSDEQGILYPIKFSRPAEVNIHVAVDVTVVNPGIWPVDAIARIQQAIVDYAENGASAVGATSGFDQVGYNTGDAVYASELMVPVNSIAGCRINHIYVGITSSPTAAQVDVAWNQIAHFLTTNIAVTVH